MNTKPILAALAPSSITIALAACGATADHHSYAGLAASEDARLNDVWNAEQAHWVSPVSSAQLISVENTSHYFQLDRPDVALDMIHDCSNESSK
jgi:hypothetical protein